MTKAEGTEEEKGHYSMQKLAHALGKTKFTD